MKGVKVVITVSSRSAVPVRPQLTVPSLANDLCIEAVTFEPLNVIESCHQLFRTLQLYSFQGSYATANGKVKIDHGIRSGVINQTI